MPKPRVVAIVAAVVAILTSSAPLTVAADVAPPPVPDVGLARVTASSSADPPAPVIAGYFFGSENAEADPDRFEKRKGIRDLPYDKITHLIYAFADTSDGRCGAEWHVLEEFAALRDIKAQYPHLRTILSFGGGHGLSDAIPAAMSSSDARADFIDSCVTLMAREGFDGLDNDWEGDGVTAPLETLLAQEMRARLDQQETLDGRDYLFTAAPWLRDGAEDLQFDFAAIHQYYDWLSFQFYDYCVGRYNDEYPSYTCFDSALHDYPGFSSPYSDRANVEHVFATMMDQYGVPASKLVLGMPFFGVYRTEVVSTTNQGLYQPSTGLEGKIAYGDIKATYSDATHPRYWESAAKMPWRFSTADRTFVTSEDYESSFEKGRYIADRGFRGLMFWEITQDADDDLVTGIVDGLDYYPSVESRNQPTVGPPGDAIGLADPETGRWWLKDATGSTLAFYYGNPGDSPIMGDWDCDDVDTPGLFRRGDGYAYLRNSNSQGGADVRFFLGNPSDIPLAGDFNGDGCDTLSLYRPSSQEFFIVNKLGKEGAGLGPAELSFVFGDPGDQPVVGDWDGDGIDEVGLHRESTGLFYWRNSLTAGVADGSLFFGDPGDRFVAGDWGTVDGKDTPAVFRPSTSSFYFRYTMSEGIADSQVRYGEAGWLPVAGWIPPGAS
jgi:GH18 family chitinase